MTPSQAANREFMRGLTALIKMCDAGNPPPNAATLKHALESVIRSAERAAREAREAGVTSL